MNKMKTNKIFTDVAIIGAGPAGLSAASTIAKMGAMVILIDENHLLGGQLVKQIHKFFGSSRHMAGIRGTNIAKELISECKKYKVELLLNTRAYGIFNENSIGVIHEKRNLIIQAKKIVIATGALENFISFPGWTLPGVMGAGAFQTIMNLHRILPGKRMLMIGAGNVGLIVSYQAIQSGVEVVAVVEALPDIGGYSVHAAKLKRLGVPILTSHTIKEAIGINQVEGATIAKIGQYGKIVSNSEVDLSVDIICVSVGLSPLAELAWMAGCKFTYYKELGGFIPMHDCNMRTSKKDIFIAGDISGIEEASIAIEEGRVAGYSVAEDLGYVEDKEISHIKAELTKSLCSLRNGPFGEKNNKIKEKLFHSFK